MSKERSFEEKQKDARSSGKAEWVLEYAAPESVSLQRIADALTRIAEAYEKGPR